jgi:hypothetical protein
MTVGNDLRTLPTGMAVWKNLEEPSLHSQETAEPWYDNWESTWKDQHTETNKGTCNSKYNKWVNTHEDKNKR